MVLNFFLIGTGTTIVAAFQDFPLAEETAYHLSKIDKGKTYKLRNFETGTVHEYFNGVHVDRYEKT